MSAQVWKGHRQGLPQDPWRSPFHKARQPDAIPTHGPKGSCDRGAPRLVPIRHSPGRQGRGHEAAPAVRRRLHEREPWPSGHQHRLGRRE